MSQEYRSPTGPARQPRSRYWLAVIPFAWMIGIFALMRPDAIVAKTSVPYQVKWLIYDESDLTALSLRGANIWMGRLPGRLDEPVQPDWDLPSTVLPQQLDAPQPEYAERFYLEYPTPTLVLFWLGHALQAGNTVEIPPIVADGQQFSIGFFTPRNDSERAIWTRLGNAVRFYVAMMTFGLVAMIVILIRGYGPELCEPGPVWLAVLPGAVFFSLNRFDVLPALATACCFACLGRGWRTGAGAWLAMGVMLKVYPVLFVPVLLRYLGPRNAIPFLLGFVGLGALGGGLSLLATDWQGTVGPVQVQLSRPLEETSWTLYGRVLPMSLGKSSTGRLAILAAFVLGVAITRPTNLASVLRRCGVILVVFVNLAVFWSPQWIVWFLPIVIPLARNRRRFIVAMLALDALNYFCFPILFWILWGQLVQDIGYEAAMHVIDAIVYVRVVAWAGLAGLFLWDELVAPRTVSPIAAKEPFHANLVGWTATFWKAGAASGTPRGLTWVSATPTGDPLFAWDSTDARLIALLPVQVQFAPIPGSDLEDVPQAHEPRTVTAMFVFDGATWQTDGRAVFNLTPQQVIERSAGRFQLQNS